MESIFRLLLHEKVLVQGDDPDLKLLTLTGYHMRDLATILETAKWMDQSAFKKHVISRHKQFIIAIREQINNVEKSLEEMEMGNPMKNSCGNLNEQDRDGLALFLSGEDRNERDIRFDSDDNDSGSLKRFLDPVKASCSTDAGIVANGCGEIKEVNMNGVVDSSHCCDSVKENNLRKVGSHYSIKLGHDPANACNGNAQDRSWDLEAGESKAKCSFHENKLSGSSSRTNLFGFFDNLWNAYGNRVPSSYTKRMKDGEKGHSSLYIDAPRAAWGPHIGLSLALEDCGHRRLHEFLVKAMHQGGLGRVMPDLLIRRSIQMILTVVFVFTLLELFSFLFSNHLRFADILFLL
ncbi:Iron-sulfur cluster biosynthesis family protein isoform 1 [Hibiscus syriacus]|uniref:Iron-sulfur cluster biosynthesis family protein isoform 1 n=1 Tax=Hibiscus syriacus TaxID=106335 RepID=A0A6A2YZ01_HIBSY|nr:Iron-sulfur cluster biosynthesis family protein isoform 1 [Hibiscus syriacus]